MLLDKLEKAKKKYTKEKRTGHLVTCIEHAWELMDEYYKLTDRSRAYVVAIVLDPRQKHQYFYRQ